MIETAALMPEVNHWSSQIAANKCPVEACVDWLMDQDATLADVLLLYAGTAPEYVDGLHQMALAKWCEQTEPRKNTWAQKPHWKRRWESVEQVSIEQYPCGLNLGFNAVVFDMIRVDVESPEDLPNREDWLILKGVVEDAWHGRPMPVDRESKQRVGASIARARRWVKRQVLSLFPEVEYAFEYLVPWVVLEEVDGRFSRLLTTIRNWNLPGHIRTFQPSELPVTLHNRCRFRKNLSVSPYSTTLLTVARFSISAGTLLT